MANHVRGHAGDRLSAADGSAIRLAVSAATTPRERQTTGCVPGTGDRAAVKGVMEGSPQLAAGVSAIETACHGVRGVPTMLLVRARVASRARFWFRGRSSMSNLVQMARKCDLTVSVLRFRASAIR